MTQQKLINNPIKWDKINYHKEVEKILYQDGFHKTKNHGLWKLKVKLTLEEWETVKPLFSFYEKTKNISNMKYFGWATIKPVEVMKIIYEMRYN